MPSRRGFIGSTLGAGLLGVAGHAFAQPAPSLGTGTKLAAAGFRGEIVTPASARYDEARRMFVANPRRENRPQIIALCTDEEDVRRALAFAREHSFELAVRAAGHDMLAASICNGFVLDLSALQSVNVDPATRTVRVGTGVRAGKLNAALAEQGLAAALGCEGRVGVSGLTLGGGLGWLVGRHGAACDHLIGARLVTADGRVLRVSPDEHPELLWALRGGGGNFGVATELTLRVHPVPAVTTGIVALRGERIADFLRRQRDYLGSAGDDVDLETFILSAEQGPMIFIKARYSGEPAMAERALAPLRRIGTFVADDLAPRAYTGLIEPTGPIAPLFKVSAMPRLADDVPGSHWCGVAAAPISDAAAEIIAERLAAAPGVWALGLGQYIHGAAARIPLSHSPMRRIDGLLNAHFTAYWRRREDAERRMAWIDEAIAALQPHSAPSYINLMSSDDPAAVRRAYGPSYSRLAAVKRAYDPDNFFRRNRNILSGAA